MNERLRRLPIQFRAEEDAPEGVLVGYASVYDVEYRIGWGLKESITRGAFDESIRAQNGTIPIFYEHRWGDTPIGTAKVSSDDTGVRVEARLFMEDQRSRNIYAAAKEGALREWSIGFFPEVIRTEADEPDVEHIDKGELIEASVVVRGANPATETVEVRSEPDVEDEPAEDDEERTLPEGFWELLGNSSFRNSVAVMVQLDENEIADEE